MVTSIKKTLQQFLNSSIQSLFSKYFNDLKQAILITILWYDLHTLHMLIRGPLKYKGFYSEIFSSAQNTKLCKVQGYLIHILLILAALNEAVKQLDTLGNFRQYVHNNGMVCLSKLFNFCTYSSPKHFQVVGFSNCQNIAGFQRQGKFSVKGLYVHQRVSKGQLCIPEQFYEFELPTCYIPYARHYNPRFVYFLPTF